MDDELSALQDALSKLDARGRGKRYPKDLKQRLIDYVRRQRDGGTTWAILSDQLGLPATTLSKWLKPKPPPDSSAAFVPVVVADDAQQEHVAIVAPNGWRIEGLTLERALVLIRAQ